MKELVERKGIEPSTFALRTRPAFAKSSTYLSFAVLKGPRKRDAVHRCCTRLSREVRENTP